MEKRIFIALVTILFFSCNEMYYIGLGDKALENGDIAKAKKYYEKAIGINKESDIPYQQLGYLYQYKIYNIDSAIVFYNTGLKLNPYNYSINYNIMYAYFNIGEIDKGINQYIILSRISSDNDIYYFPLNIIDTLLVDLNLVDRIKFCNKYLEINNTDMNLRKRLIDIYKNIQDYSSLEKELIKYLDYLPNDVKEYKNEKGEIYFKIGFCNFKMKNYDKSLEYFKLAETHGISVPVEFYNEVNKKIIENLEKQK